MQQVPRESGVLGHALPGHASTLSGLTRGAKRFSKKWRREEYAPAATNREEMKMANLNSKSIYRMTLAKAMAWGALAVCIPASPAMAQDEIDGKFTLTENARFGDTVLGAGQYKFSIEPIGTIQSIRSIQQGAGHLVLVTVRPEKSGPVASIFAMASPSNRAREANELILEPEKAGTLAESMYLERDGLVVDFRWASPKAKRQVVAQQIVPVRAATVVRSGGND
jgi:hypothetical protein